VNDLEKQIAKEKEQLANVKYVPIAQLKPDKNMRCHFCGQLSDDLQLVGRVGDFERYRGRCCGG
jgi:hypothetical protein